MRSINPATGEALASYEELSSVQLEARLASAAAVFPAFADRSRLEDRLACLRRAAGILEAEADRWARLITLEMGKPISQSRAEIAKCASVCRYYAERAGDMLADEDRGGGAYVRWLPLGPVLAVMPWNFPFWQVFRFAAPALAAGNVGLLKHASNVPGSALAIEEIFREAGFPEGAFQTLLIPSGSVAGVIADPRIRALTLTGSEAAGVSCAIEAGRHLKKSVLELGGSDPFIVMPSADVSAAAAVAVRSRMQNAGQSCIAAKRFIVHADVYEDFHEACRSEISALRVGDPLDPATDMGPLATSRIRDDLIRQVADTLASGAKVSEGARPLDGPGYFYRPGLLTDVPVSAPAYGEELFGPVACLFRVASASEAIALANVTRFGLGSAVWTRDEDEKARFIDGIEAGFTAINGMTASDPRLPFGGVKASGFGRELADLGMKEFLNAKTVTRA
jgi:succinate-semialdehyde dehydrogenase/glutarate-semialdehyde dehydrogenase